MFGKVARYILYFCGILFIILVILIIFTGVFFRVHPNQHAVVFEFGVPVRTITKAGIDFKLPFIQHVSFCNMRTRSTKIDLFYAQTEDFAKIGVKGSVGVRIHDCIKYLTSSPPNDPLIDIILNSISRESRNIISQYQLHDIVGKQEEISLEIVDRVNPSVVPFGVGITDLYILFEKEEDLGRNNT